MNQSPETVDAVRPKIVFLNHWAAALGGAELSLLDILETAVRRSEAFLATAEEGALVDRARGLGVSVSVLPCSPQISGVRREGLLSGALRQWRGICAYLRFVLALRRFIARTRPQLVYANVPKSHVALFLISRMGYAGRCCFHVREIFAGNSLPFRTYRHLFRPGTGSVIAISHAVRAALPPPLKRRSVVIHNGVAVITARHREKEPGRPLRFVYLGRVVPWKGCDLLIDAFAEIYKSRSAAAGTLTIIGGSLYWDRSYRDGLAAAIEGRHIAPACRLLPHTADPLETLCAYDVFCTASRDEPFGRAIAEAQGCGLPVIAFAAGGVPEIVVHNETGLLVPPGDKVAFVRAMERFLDEPGLIPVMGHAGRERVARYFNRETQIEEIVKVLLRGASAQPEPE